MRSCCSNIQLPTRASRGFTILEMLVVIAIVGALMVLVIPTLRGVSSAGNLTNAAYEVAGTLERARSYATANNTYVWVGFFEEDGARGSTCPATAGTGRIVLSVVASRDGTAIYNLRSTKNPDPIDPSRLLQVGKLVKIDNVHLAILPNGNTTGVTLDTRPYVDPQYGRYGEVNALGSASRPSTNSRFPFVYPIVNGAVSDVAQYTFMKTLQFGPRGEASINSTYELRQVVEIGLQPAHGNAVDTASKNVAAVQITGIAGNVKIYQR